LKVPKAVEQRGRLQVGCHSAGGHEILAEPLAEIARFSNVYDALKPILHQVNAGLMRNVAQLLIWIWLFSKENRLHKSNLSPGQRKLQPGRLWFSVLRFASTDRSIWPNSKPKTLNAKR